MKIEQKISKHDMFILLFKNYVPEFMYQYDEDKENIEHIDLTDEEVNAFYEDGFISDLQEFTDQLVGYNEESLYTDKQLKKVQIMVKVMMQESKTPIYYLRLKEAIDKAIEMGTGIELYL